MATATAIDPQQYVQQAIRKVTSIATLPEITAKIIRTVEDPEAPPPPCTRSSRTIRLW